MRQVVGVACIMVTLWASISRVSSLASYDCSLLAMTSRPPTISGSSNSRMEMSNETVVIARKVSAGPSPGVSAIDSRKFSRALRGTMTPLGLPVDPEV